MSRAAKSLFAFGVYVIVAGVGFLVAPNVVLSVIGVPTTTEVWIRVVGLVVSVLGITYIGGAIAGAPLYSKVTVGARIFAVVAFVALVLLRLGPPPLLGFALIDAAGASWTGLALRADRVGSKV